MCMEAKQTLLFWMSWVPLCAEVPCQTGLCHTSITRSDLVSDTSGPDFGTYFDSHHYRGVSVWDPTFPTNVPQPRTQIQRRILF